MAEERIVQRQIATRAAPVAPAVSAESMGAGVGLAVEQMGNVIHSERLEDAQIERRLRENAELSDFNVAFANAREELAALAREDRQTDQPGHAKRIAEAWRKREGELLGRLTSQRLKEQGQASLANWGGAFREREAAWEELRQSEITVERFDDSLRVSEGRVRRLENPADYRAERDVQIAAVEAMDIDDKTREALLESVDQRLAVNFLRGMNDRDPAATRALIESGQFDGVLTGDQAEVLLNASDVEQRRIAAQIEREQAAQRGALKERLSVFREAERQGLIEEPEVYDQAIALAKSLGDESLALELEGLKFDTQFTKVWGPENADAVQREQRMAALASKESRNDAEKRELAFLRKHSREWASREASDPVGIAMERGGAGAPPPIDFTRPDTLAARGQWAAARGVAPLSQTEARALGNLFDSGASGREQALGLLARFPAGAAMRAASMMDPDDRTLPIIATLPERSRMRALRGRDALEANRALLKDMRKDDLDLDTGIAEQQAEFFAALGAVPDTQKAALIETAEQIVAGYVSAGYKPDARAFEMALSMALGSTGNGEDQRGGLSRWRGNMFLLPAGVTKGEFKAEVLRKAQDNILKPVNPDGSPANLLRADPVPVAPGLYEFHTDQGRPIMKEGGGVWRVRVGEP